jgi:hypothetical protein
MTLQEINNVVGVVLTVFGVLGTLARAIPAPAWTRIERELPRVANTFRAMRAAGPDVVKFARAVWAIVRGTPWGQRIAPVVDAVDRALPRDTVAPPPPAGGAL